MAKLRKPKKPKISQSQRFIEMARSLGADDDEATFKGKLAQIAKAKPPPKAH